jgi:hypothetical protein
MIIVAALYLLKNSIKERYAIVLFGILLIFHIVDTEKYWGNISMINHEKKIDKKFVGLRDSRWDELLDSRKAILVIPITSQLPRIPSCPIFEKIGYLAMRKNISTNCVYLSRYDSNKVQESKLSLELSLEGGTLKVDSLYILTQQDIERFKSDFLKNGVAYEYVDGLWVAYKD